MKSIFHALEPKILQQFIETKKELLQIASSMTAKERSEGKKEIMESAVLYEVPRDLDDPRELYNVDADGTAVIPIRGKLVAEADICDGFFSDCTTYDFIQTATTTANDDVSVKKIQYSISSGGGHVTGVDVCGQVIANSVKPTEGMVFGMAASAAYWLASQMDEITVSAPTDFVGSIGVAVEIVDYRKQDEAQGIQRIVLTSTDAPDKRVDYTTEEGQAKEVEELDAIHQVFVSRIAAGRGVSIDKINSDFGKGGVVIAAQALKSGMIDKVENAIGISTQTSAMKTRVTETPAAGGNKPTGEVTKMTLEEFLAANPAEQSKIDAMTAKSRTEGEATGKDGVKATIAAASPYLASEAYPTLGALALKVITGEESASTLTISVSTIDAMREQAKGADAVVEQGKETPGQATKLEKAGEEGMITGSADDVAAAAKMMREG